MQSQPPPPPEGWHALLHRLSWTEFHIQNLTQSHEAQGEEIRELRSALQAAREAARDQLDKVKAEHSALLVRVLWGLVAVGGSAIFRSLWEIITKAAK